MYNLLDVESTRW